jgi:hypothetical protein
MGMPSGDSPQKVDEIYDYLQGHAQTFHDPATWQVHWLDLAWLWGFLIAIAVVMLGWIWQYRSTRQKSAIYPADTFGGYTTELAGPATAFFLLLCVFLTLFAVAIIVAHIVFGQLY